MGDGADAAVALAEALDAPVATSYLHNDAFPAAHRLWCGPLGYHGSKAAMQLIHGADVVLALGSRLGPFGTLPQYDFDYWPKGAKLIQVDADPRVLGLVKKPAVTICGDAREAALALVARLAGAPRSPAPRTATSASRGSARRGRRGSGNSKAGTPRRTRGASRSRAARSTCTRARCSANSRRRCPQHAMVSTDIGNICQIANSYLRFERPRSMFGAMMFGNCGYAFPTAIGCKAAAPERPAVAYVGDGAWGMSFGEILTCVREQIPVTAVVFNNQQWGAEKKNHVDFYSNRFLGVNLDNPSFAAVARAMGAEGHTIEKLSDVGPALRAACAAQAEGRTTILEMMVTQELGDPFRRDALQKPKRLLEKYKGCQ